jgi:DNA modification methylase
MPLKVVYRPLKGLVPYAKNSMQHPAAQIEKIMASMAEFGWTNPLLVADNDLIAGHARLVAALQIAEAGLVIPGNKDPWAGPTVDLSHLTKNQRAAYVIADNRLARDGKFDNGLLAEELGWLSDDGFDIGLIGFEDDELALLLGGVAPGEGPDPDDVPETPVHPVTQPGDIWICGKHRICCADSRDPQMVSDLLNGVEPHLMITDPPCADYDPEDRGRARNADGKALSTGKHRSTSKVEDVADWTEAYRLFPGDVAYVWHAAINPGATQKSLEAAGFRIRMQIIRAKSSFVVSRGHYHLQHEPCFYAVREKKTAHWVGDRKQSTLWEIDKAPKNSSLSTEKPVECMLRPMENNSSTGQVVYDPFLGSGSTIMAGQLSGRFVYGCEVEPAIVDVAVLRWMRFSEEDAILEATGKCYGEMAALRPYDEAVAAE